MKIEPFALERYFARYEFTARHLLSPSDCESLRMDELLALANPDTRRLWDTLNLGYTESPGHPLLREEIARLYPGLDAGQILTAAPEEAIFIAMNTLLHPGDRVIVLAPAYQSLHAVARAAGCAVVDWPLANANGRWSLDLNRLEDLLSVPAQLVVVNFPNNPTGFLPTLPEWRSLLALVQRSGAALFSDEMYRLLEHDPATRLPPACTLYQRAVSLAGLSKAFGLPGLRTGWLATQDAGLLAGCQAFKDYTTICASAPSEILSIAALRAKEHILARNLAIVQHNLAAARAFFAKRPEHFAWFEPQAGSIAFPRWLGAPPIEELAESVVARSGVMIVPGSMFQWPGGHFRVGLGRKTMLQALELFGQYLDEAD